MNQKLLECVPNFSEGRDTKIIDKIVNEVKTTKGVTLLNVDPGKATNRTVVTFVGNPNSVIEAAFKLIKKSSELIDMEKHSGEHPRMGATDVCPLIPVSNITMEETIVYAKKLAEKVGNELSIPVYLYENSASKKYRRNLSEIRQGEYEGLKNKLKDKRWQPDFGSQVFENIKKQEPFGVA